MNRFIQALRNPKRMGVIPFFMLGDPTPEASLALIKAAIDQGVDALELGIPFSDPVADGPVIQRSAERALKAGANFAVCVDLLKQIRAYNAHIPIGLLLYYNLLHRQGVSQVHARLNDAGIDAILAVDLPLEESASHEASLKQHGLGNISLIAPNTDETRAKLLLEHTTAFAYVVSSFGTTGVRTTLPEALPKRLQALKALGKSVPLVVGFGIAEAKQVNELRGAGADAVIIGSAITRLIEDNLASPKQAVTALQQFLTQLKG